jgi:SSS family solute:Na+ symporter
VFGHVVYIAIAAFVLNLAVAIVVTVICRLLHLPEGTDETRPDQYSADPEPGTPAINSLVTSRND